MPPRVSHASSPVRPLPVRHLPLIRHAIDELGIRRAVDRLCPPDARHVVSDGDCVAVMVMNILHGRIALYDMGTWLGDTDVELLLGEGTPADAFHDDRLGHALDRLFAGGTEFIFSEVAQEVLTRPEVGTEYGLHVDTTTLLLHGQYEEDPGRPWPVGSPRPLRGYSKDHRPDLKQLVFGLSIHGPTRVPLGFSVLDGNTADPRANRFQIESLTQLLPSHHEVTLVGDCKFVDAKTLGRARQGGFHYVSLLSHNFGLRAKLVEQVRVACTELSSVGEFPGRTLADDARRYSATSSVHPFAVEDPQTGERRLVEHRFVVVRSSRQEEEFDSTVDSRIEKAETRLSGALARLAKRDFACASDLREEVERVVGESEYHAVRFELTSGDIVVKRAGAGRPRKGEEAPTETRWRLAEHAIARDEAKIEIARFHAAHFVLVTDHLDAAKWSDERIFSTWRGQQSIEGHAGFRWLKGVADVAPVFLKLPHRIQALALVFMFALMVRNWLEAYIRAKLAETGEKLPNFLDKPISRPTAENVLYLFRAVIVLATVEGERITSREVHFLEGYALDVLRLFGLDETLFTRPPKKSWSGIDRMSAM